jgi:diguanylate cyclase
MDHVTRRPAGLPAVQGMSFEAASAEVLRFLRDRFGFALWMVTRTRGDDWIVLQADDDGYGVRPGRVHRWQDTVCYRMVEGAGPRIAPDARSVPAYADAPIGQQMPIGAYVGVPLTMPDGSLFGTLCAIDPAPQPADLEVEQELVELLAALLNGVLVMELGLADANRTSERLATEASTDPLTQLANRRAWEAVLDHEESRCRRYGHGAAIIVIDLDGLKVANDTNGHAAGDALLVSAAEALRSVARQADVAARLGGDEFGLIAVECDEHGAATLEERLRAALHERGVGASIGVCVREPCEDLRSAWRHADERMYEDKRLGDAGHGGVRRRSDPTIDA